MSYDDKEDLCSKVDHEGGLLEAILSYGIRHQELPPGTPSDVVISWRWIEENVPGHVQVIDDWLDEPDDA